MDTRLRKPWMVAVWPGMGGVAQIAGSYLVRQLGAEAIGELDAAAWFDPQSISVKGGLMQAPEKPHSAFFAWKDPAGERDLLILIADRQPSHQGYRYSEALLEVAAQHGVERVFTFAAMATQILPSAPPHVFAVSTREELLTELHRDSVRLLEEGEVSGLNGVFIAAAAARGLPAICLLGEFPFFAASVPNPKASAAVLRVFTALSGTKLDMTAIDSDAREIERGLTRHLEGLQRAARRAARAAQGEEPAEDEESGEESDDTGDEEEAEEAATGEAEGGEPRGGAEARAPRLKPIPPEVLERIEQLFAQTSKDRARALDLKAELDRHGLFKRFEDRFLDLFKQAG
jgi:uncharacterized protein